MVCTGNTAVNFSSEKIFERTLKITDSFVEVRPFSRTLATTFNVLLQYITKHPLKVVSVYTDDPDFKLYND